MDTVSKYGLIAILFLATSHIGQAAQFNLPPEIIKNGFGHKKIVLFEPDIVLMKVLGTGRTEVQADWNEQGMKNMRQILTEFFAHTTTVLLPDLVDENTNNERFQQVIALHKTVGLSIMSHKLRPLPTKKDTFHWTIGSGAQQITEVTGADYGLFTYYRRGYTSASRVGLAVLGAFAGIAVPTHYQIGFSSLVDLKTGKIVWFHQLDDSNGDLRYAHLAQYTVSEMLEDFPGLTLPKLDPAS